MACPDRSSVLLKGVGSAVTADADAWLGVMVVIDRVERAVLVDSEFPQTGVVPA